MGRLIECHSSVDNFLQAVDTTAPFNYTYTPQGTGIRKFQASAFDNDEESSTSSIVTLIVNPAAKPTARSFSFGGQFKHLKQGNKLQ